MPSQGRLEIWHGTWGTVCRQGFGRAEATVACQQRFGAHGTSGEVVPWTFRGATAAGRATGPIWLARVACSGREQSLETCRHSRWGDAGNCTHASDVSIRCSFAFLKAPLPKPRAATL